MVCKSKEASELNHTATVQKYFSLSMEKMKQFFLKKNGLNFVKRVLEIKYRLPNVFFKSSIFSKTVTTWIRKTRSTTMEKRGAFGYRWARQKVEP